MSLSLPDSVTRNRAASTGESGLPEHEHKRPRLSDSQTLSLTPPTDQHISRAEDYPVGLAHPPPVLPSSRSPLLTENHANSPLDAPPQSTPPSSMDLSATHTPTSKVTINTRPLSSQSPRSEPVILLDAHAHAGSGAHSPSGPSPTSTIAASQLNEPIKDEYLDTISISSSDSTSPPPIEVAAPEDYDQDSSASQWQTVSQSNSHAPVVIGADYVHRTFPHANRFPVGSAHVVLTHLAIPFTFGHPSNDGLFREVKDWLIELVQKVTSLDRAVIDGESEFWSAFPQTVTQLLKREAGLSSNLDVKDITGYFVAFVRLTSIIADIEATRFRSYPDTVDGTLIRPAMTPTYIQQCRFFICTERLPLYQVLFNSFNMTPGRFVREIIDELSKPGPVPLLRSVANLVAALSTLLSKRQNLVDHVVALMRESALIIKAFGNRFQDEDRSFEFDIDEISAAALQILTNADAALELAIIKQHAWLTIESSEKILTQFDNFIRPLVQTFPQLSKDIVASSGVDPALFEPEEIIHLANLAWKFTTLRKFIRHGRMELRVSGIGTMAGDLIKVFHDFIGPPLHKLDHPFVRLLVHFIRDNGLVRYVIGVDSHPQIINRSSNVIGFLCVSNTYRTEDTDAIWQAFIDSQDQRTGAEVLQVLQSNFDNLDCTALEYITQKLVDLPFARVDDAVFAFTKTLLESALIKVKTRSTDMDAAISLLTLSTKLCLQFLRESSVPSCAATDLAHNIRQHFPMHIKQRLELTNMDSSPVVSSDSLQLMFQDLCDDLRNHSPQASGSAIAAYHILSVIEQERAVSMVLKFDFVRLVVEDLVLISNPTIPANAARAHWLDYECRLGTFFFLMIHVSESFTDDLLETIWSDLLSSKQTQAQVRSTSWSHLANIMELCRMRNPAFDRLIQNYLPRLSPSEYDESVLRFAQQAVHYETRISPPELMEAQQNVVIPGIERIWTIMLEAPTDLVEIQASEFIIREHLDSASIINATLSTVEATHVALIERCVQQVIDTAEHIKAEQTSNSSPARSSHVTEDRPGVTFRIRFYRSLRFLRKFLEALKIRPRFTQPVQVDLRQYLDGLNPRGEPFELTLQVHNHLYLGNQLQKWTVGKDNTAAEIWQFLSTVTRWTGFTSIYRGQRVVLKDNPNTLQALNFKPGMLMVNKTPGTTDLAPDRAMRASSPVDNKVMHHFDDLYSLLGLDNDLARAVYEFLVMFSSQDATLQKLRSRTLSARELLPVEQPYKLMYYARALRSCIEDESFSASPDAEFLTYAVTTIIKSLTQFDSLNADVSLRLSITHGLTEALVLALRAKVSEGVSLSYVEDHSKLSELMLAIWSQAQQVRRSPDGLPPVQNIVRTPFEAIVEISLHDEALWAPLLEKGFSEFFTNALQHHEVSDVRQAILDVVHSLTGSALSKSMSKPSDVRAPWARFSSTRIDLFLARLWSVLVDRIPDISATPSTCAEFADACLSVFKRHGKKLEEGQILAYIHQCKLLLLSHRYEERMGMCHKDFVPLSLGKLLLECFKVQPALSRQESETGSLGRDIFTTFLFPPLSEGVDTCVVYPLVLDMQTREVLYDLIVAVSGTPAGLKSITYELDSDLIPKDYYFQPTSGNDRQRIRSEVGYAGLRNLANTCYLNSLLSQLFMNVEFRQFLLDLDIVDGTKQKLIAELAKVFAYMQNSLEDAVSPDSAVDAITQWDGEQIDVTIQMDVDEFFNLLFDRIEFQIPDMAVRTKFKSIYGGQLVQQIKSKECEHVSERLEPFSAVQVEIKGKAGLEDSLRAYVEGEVLQGENKYSCTSCGKHVDAIKRACLKELPDHLIFNLKRFDYDIMTGMRCKINDEFAFPQTIDMSPYMLEALSNPDARVQPDLFELVGIIVHSGTAESGHYYSYIRDRPSNHSIEHSWIQFNDQDVTRFDPSTIRDNCFGGIDYGAVQCPKFYNGYMVFYQRTSSIQNLQRQYTADRQSMSPKIPIPSELERHIAQQNELYLRSYVAQDPIHATFVKNILHQLPVNSNETCSADHELEMQVSQMALDYVDQLSARWKEFPEVEETLKTLELHATRCAKCAQAVVTWFLKDTHFSDNIVRSCYPIVRRAFSNLLTACWQALAESKGGRSQYFAEQPTALEIEHYESLLSGFCRVAAACWDHLQRHGRAWDQYFGVLSSLVRLGQEEAQFVIDEDFLERALELVHVTVPSHIYVKRLRSNYQVYLSGRERNRPFNHGPLVQFLADMLPCVALDAPPGDGAMRPQVGNKLGLLYDETVLLGLHVKNAQLRWLKIIILGAYNMDATDSIITCLARTKKLNRAVCTALKDGLQERQILAAVSFLRPSLVFLSHAVDDQPIIDLVELALESVDTTGGQYGGDFLEFISAVIKLENHEMPFDAGALTQFVYENMNHWAPVLLMHPNDLHADVRTGTAELIKELVFLPLETLQHNESPTEYNSMLSRIHQLLEACAIYAQNTFLNTQSKDQHMELQAGQAHQVLSIVEMALPLLTDNAEDEERAARVSAVFDDLRLKSEGAVDTMTTADWRDVSSDLEASDPDYSE